LKGSEPNLKLLKVLQDLQLLLRETADPRQAPAMEAYMKHRFPFLGIKKPERAACIKPILSEAKSWPDEDLHASCIWLWNQPEREFQYVAVSMLEAGKKQWTAESYELMLRMVTEKSWWDSVDTIASNLIGTYLLRQAAELRAAEARRLSADSYLWNQRTALLFQLMYKQQTDTALLAELIQAHSGSKEFFIQKAIGWVLRQYARTDASWVRAFVDENMLAKLSAREALKHLR
jgi:3-methyladenine DNA glycosylase AlkD